MKKMFACCIVKRITKRNAVVNAKIAKQMRKIMGCDCCKIDNPSFYEKCGGYRDQCLLEVIEYGGKIRRTPTNYTKPKKKRRKR